MNFRTFKFIALLTAALLAVTGQGVLAAEPMSKAQLDKLNALIARVGNEIDPGKLATDALGITEASGAPILVRGIGSDHDGSNLIHQVVILPGGKGYMFTRFIPGRNFNYWADKNLKLVSAAVKPNGQPWIKAPATEARDGLRDELVFFAKAADNPDAY